MNRVFSLIAAAVLLTGCFGGHQPPTSLDQTPDAFAIRNNSYALLYDLLNDEKDVKFLRFIRPEDVELKNLTKKISTVSKRGEKELEEMARSDASIDLKALNLPPGEKATRDAISQTKEHDLLTLKGRKFDLALLLTQTEALNYGWHLSTVAAAHDSNPARAQKVSDLGQELEALYREAFGLEMALDRQ